MYPILKLIAPYIFMFFIFIFIGVLLTTPPNPNQVYDNY
jgi:hypothetical protein